MRVSVFRIVMGGWVRCYVHEKFFWDCYGSGTLN